MDLTYKTSPFFILLKCLLFTKKVLTIENWFITFVSCQQFEVCCQ